MAAAGWYFRALIILMPFMLSDGFRILLILLNIVKEGKHYLEHETYVNC